MSADNCIAVLHTRDKFKVIPGEGGWHENIAFGTEKRIDAWRVAETSAIDNYEWYAENEPHNLGYYLQEVWGSSFVFYSENEAHEHAVSAFNPDDTEYGVVGIEAVTFNFPGC